MIDAAPVDYVPTWRNGRKWVEGVSKRIDRFSIDKYLAASMNNF